jgi:pimeloyl-ACP methyl ester carboxylesterase
VTAFLDAVGVDEPVALMGHSFGGGVAIVVAHDAPARVARLVLINSIGGSAWTAHGSIVQSMAERPLWDWGLHLPADVMPVRQLRRVLPVVLSEALPNALRNPKMFVVTANLARRADLTPELEALKRQEMPIVVLWGASDRIVTRAAFESLCSSVGRAECVTVEGNHSWLIGEPRAFGEVITNVVGVAERLDRA